MLSQSIFSGGILKSYEESLKRLLLKEVVSGIMRACQGADKA